MIHIYFNQANKRVEDKKSYGGVSFILKCGSKDENRIFFIINEAAKAYNGVIPYDCYHIPYMPVEELRQEMKAMTFYGYKMKDELIAVMGIQPLGDVTFIRHSYVLPNHQYKGER